MYSIEKCVWSIATMMNAFKQAWSVCFAKRKLFLVFTSIVIWYFSRRKRTFFFTIFHKITKMSGCVCIEAFERFWKLNIWLGAREHRWLKHIGAHHPKKNTKMSGYARIQAFGWLPENTPPGDRPLIRIRRTMHTRCARRCLLVCVAPWSLRQPLMVWAWLALFTFSKIGGRTGAGKWLGSGWGRALKPAFGVETLFVIYAIEVMTKKKLFFFLLLGPACYIIG